MSSDVVTIANRFAAILDGRNYDALGDVLTSDSRYEFRDRVVEGSSEIIEVYRLNTEWGFDVIDRIEFESDVQADSANSARVTFTDRLFHKAQAHEHKCQQIVFVDDGGRIHRIVHIDLDGEGPALDAYLTKCGIVRPNDSASTKRTFECDGERYRQTSAHQKEWGARLIAELSLCGDERILDIGCGDGFLTAQLADCVPRGSVLGIDSSMGMLTTARTNARENLSFTLLDITEADFDCEFDVVFSNATLHWIKDHVKLLRTLHRALKRGGVMRVNFAADGNCPTWFGIARQLIATDFREAFVRFEWPYYMPPVDVYEQLLRDSPFSDARVWGENADRYFPDEAAMLGWLAPSVVPFKQHLDADTAERFHSAVAARLIAEAKQEDGTCFEKFRRVNVLARK